MTSHGKTRGLQSCDGGLCPLPTKFGFTRYPAAGARRSQPHKNGYKMQNVIPGRTLSLCLWGTSETVRRSTCPLGAVNAALCHGCVHRRTVGYSEGQEIAATNGALFFEASVQRKRGRGGSPSAHPFAAVELTRAPVGGQIFHDSALRIHQKILSGEVDTSNEVCGLCASAMLVSFPVPLSRLCVQFHGVLVGDMPDPKRTTLASKRRKDGGSSGGNGYMQLEGDGAKADGGCCCTIS
jgi:hypothetical protein